MGLSFKETKKSCIWECGAVPGRRQGGNRRRQRQSGVFWSNAVSSAWKMQKQVGSCRGTLLHFDLHLLGDKEAGGLHRELFEAEGMIFVHRINTLLEEGGGEREKFLRKHSTMAWFVVAVRKAWKKRLVLSALWASLKSLNLLQQLLPCRFRACNSTIALLFLCVKCLCLIAFYCDIDNLYKTFTGSKQVSIFKSLLGCWLLLCCRQELISRSVFSQALSFGTF